MSADNPTVVAARIPFPSSLIQENEALQRELADHISHLTYNMAHGLRDYGPPRPKQIIEVPRCPDPHCRYATALWGIALTVDGEDVRFIEDEATWAVLGAVGAEKVTVPG